MATHSSILKWKTPWTEEPGRLPSTGSQRVGYDWVTSLSLSLVVKNMPANAEARDVGLIPVLENPLEEDMAPHSSVLVWRIPWTGEPGRLQSMGSQRVWHHWSNLKHRYLSGNHDGIYFRQEDSESRIGDYVDFRKNVCQPRPLLPPTRVQKSWRGHNFYPSDFREIAMSSSLEWDLSSLSRYWTLITVVTAPNPNWGRR